MEKYGKILGTSIILLSSIIFSEGATAVSLLNNSEIISTNNTQKVIANETKNLNNISHSKDSENFLKDNKSNLLKIIENKNNKIDKVTEIKKSKVTKKKATHSSLNKNKKSNNPSNKKKDVQKVNENGRVKLKSKNAILIDGEYYIIANKNKTVTINKKSSKTVYVNGRNITVNGVTENNPHSKSNSHSKTSIKTSSTSTDFFAGKNNEWKCEIKSGDAHLKDWVAKVRSRILVQFTSVNTIGGYREGDPQDHGTGNALDVMVPVKSKLGDNIANWAIANSQYLNIKYVIWKQHIWLSGDPTEWRGMEDRGSITQNHYDHVHLSFYDGNGVCPTN